MLAGIVTLVVKAVEPPMHPAVQSPQEYMYCMSRFCEVYYILSGFGPLKPGVVRWIGGIASVIVIYCMGYIVYYEFDKWGIF